VLRPTDGDGMTGPTRQSGSQTHQDRPHGTRGAGVDCLALAGLLVGYMLLAGLLTATCVCLGIAAAVWAESQPWTAVAIGAVVLVACVLAGPVAVHGRDLGVVEDK